MRPTNLLVDRIADVAVASKTVTSEQQIETGGASSAVANAKTSATTRALPGLDRQAARQ
jgi:hypothetical protein